MCPLKTLTGGKCSTLASKTGCNAHEKKGRVIMKRLIGILLVVLVVFGFVACDSDNPSPSGSASMPADENVLAVFKNVMGDLGQLFGSSPEAMEILKTKFDLNESTMTYTLKANQTVEGPISGFVYTYAVVRNGSMEADVKYSDGTSNHSFHFVIGNDSLSIVYDGSSYYVDSTMAP